MQEALRVFGVVAGIVAFILCLIGGIGLQDSGEKTFKYIGLYFIGKGVFVAGSLIVMSLRDLQAKAR